MEPKVTGLSPMEGPPGTIIKVRGENLGKSSTDIIKLTVNGADCLPYLEWKSPNKIITRCARVLGSGDIIITTRSGGIGTCDVPFECKEESVGLTDESLVWVDEIDFQISEKESSTVPTTSEDYNNVTSVRFNPGLFLNQNYFNANLMDLEHLHTKLKSDLANANPEVINSTNRIVSMKSNLPTIMECLQILEHLSKVLTTSKDASIDNIVKSIKQNLEKTHELFDPLLAQKDLVQSIENAMHVFKQNETIFNLPSAIETSIKSKNYDYVVKEISGVIVRLKTINIEQSLTEKIELDVNTKVEKLKTTIAAQLYQSCHSTNGGRNIDDVKKLIGHLNRLGSPVNYDVWQALHDMSSSLTIALDERFDYFLEKAKNGEDLNQEVEPPYVVQFVQSAMKIFHNNFYDILALGHSYFDPKDEFFCKEISQVESRQVEFDKIMISKPIADLCDKLRRALIPDSSELEEPSDWPSDESESYVNWLKHVLQSVITCQITLTKVNLTATARALLEKDFKELVFDLRVRSMEILFKNATRINENLHHKEDWVIEVDDLHGGITKLPSLFENNVIATIKFANEVILKTDEQSILKRIDVQGKVKNLALTLINAFILSLDNSLGNTKSKDSNYMNCLLISICNCQFAKDVLFVRLQDEFKKLEGLKMKVVFEECRKKYNEYIVKKCDKFCEIKCKELSDNSTNVEDLQMNLMIVNAQIFMVAPQLVNNLMTSVINTMQGWIHL